MEDIRICWCTGLCTASCTPHVGLSNSANCCFCVSRTVNELFPLCLNYFYSSRTAQSVILMFTMCLFMDVFSAANCSSTLGTNAAASVELKWISSTVWRNQRFWTGYRWSSHINTQVFLNLPSTQLYKVIPKAFLDKCHLCSYCCSSPEWTNLPIILGIIRVLVVFCLISQLQKIPHMQKYD